MPLLDLQKCTIRFGGLTAVSALDLQIGERDLIGLIGPNGAGKTTVFNIVTGVYRPTDGSITLKTNRLPGKNQTSSPVAASRALFKIFAYLPLSLFSTMSARDSICVCVTASPTPFGA